MARQAILHGRTVIFKVVFDGSPEIKAVTTKGTKITKKNSYLEKIPFNKFLASYPGSSLITLIPLGSSCSLWLNVFFHGVIDQYGDYRSAGDQPGRQAIPARVFELYRKMELLGSEPNNERA